MRVLVTGGAGYIGSHACKALAAAGHEPIVYDNLRTGHRWAVKWGPFRHGDILDRALFEDTLRRDRIDAVMHFAALAYVGESVERPDLYYRTNVAGTLLMLDAMRSAGVGRLVFSSSCATYGEPAKGDGIVETTAQAPINPYGRTKLMIEHVLQDYARAFDIAPVALRYFNAAGADPDGETGEEHDPETHLIPLVLQAAAGQRPDIAIFGDDYATPDGTCVRDYIHVSDLASAHVAALDACEAGAFKAYNLGTGAGVSVREIIDAARAATGREIPARIAERRPGDPPVLVADARLASDALGWTPKHTDLAEMIGSAWAWMAEGRTRVGLPSADLKRGG